MERNPPMKKIVWPTRARTKVSYPAFNVINRSIDSSRTLNTKSTSNERRGETVRLAADKYMTWKSPKARPLGPLQWPMSCLLRKLGMLPFGGGFFTTREALVRKTPLKSLRCWEPPVLTGFAESSLLRDWPSCQDMPILGKSRLRGRWQDCMNDFKKAVSDQTNWIGMYTTSNALKQNTDGQTNWIIKNTPGYNGLL